MIKGVAVTVRRPSTSGTDRFGNPVKTWTTETVNNVLISPGATADLEASRPEGVTVDLSLHFPKTYNLPLEGCEVVLPAPWSGTYNVIGVPTPYIDANTPTSWHMPVEVTAAHG